MNESAPVTPVDGSTDAVRSALTEHPSPARFVVARGVFAGTTPKVDDGLYSTIVSGQAHRERFQLHLEKGAVVDTDTYFGRFAASYFQRWTTVDRVEVGFSFVSAGTSLVRLIGSDSGGNERTIDAAEIDGEGTAVLKAAIDTYLDGGSLWVEFSARGGRLDVTDLEWTVASPSTVRPAAIAICTFNRADDCAETVAAIAGDPSMLSTIDAVYVVDQGTDHVADRELFAEVAARLGDKLVYIQQPNLGGAGGFTRGMFEVTAVNEHANIILMDDDILCEPESILRMNAFANVTTEPTLVGAQMLYLMNPQNLHVSAEEADLGNLKAGRWAVNSLHDANLLKKRQDKRVDAGYNAWWSCLIPAEVVSALGLPLPMFFQWDDIEYGIRARKAGFATVTLPNAGVWHADFHWKDRDDWAKYFSARNSLIVAALHSDFDVKTLSKKMAREISQYVVSMQYGLAHTMLRGIEDFLYGPSVLSDGGQAVLGAIRAERSMFPETVKHRADAIPGVRSADIVTRLAGFEPKKNRLDLVLAKRVVSQWRGDTQHGIFNIPAAEAHWWHVSLFDHVVVSDASQSGVRVRRRDKEVARDIAERAAKLLKRFREEGPQAQAQYREEFSQLTSRENWARLYGK